MSRTDIMKWASIIVIGVLIANLTSIFGTSNAIYSTRGQNSNYYNSEFTIKSALTISPPIEIASDLDLAAFPGSGTEDDPYIIEGLNITTSSTVEKALYIHDTTKYFIVRNCYTSGAEIGIYIYNAASGTAKIVNNTCENHGNMAIFIHKSDSTIAANNTCKNNNRGIYAYFSQDINIANNTCIGNYIGITVDSCSNLIAYNNTLSHSTQDSTYIVYSDNIVVQANNFVFNEGDGIFINYAQDIAVIDNTFRNANSFGLYGIYLTQVSSVNITGNNLENCGVGIFNNLIANYKTIEFHNNNVNGKSIAYIVSDNNLIIDQDIYGQAIVVNSTEITIENQVFEKVPIGVYILESTNVTIYNNSIADTKVSAVLVSKSSGITVVQNNFSRSDEWGLISLGASDNLNIANNTLNHEVNYGIELSGIQNATILNNTCVNTGDVFTGIYSANSANITMGDNQCINCGIYIYESNLDAYLSYTLFNNKVNGKKLGYLKQVSGQILNQGTYGQLYIINCSDITFSHQQIENVSLGVFIYYSTNITIADSSFLHVYSASSYLSTIISYYSEILTISNNTFSDCNEYTILVSGCNNASILSNFLKYGEIGIKIYSTDNGLIKRNILVNYTNYAIKIQSSDNWLIYENVFVNNNLGGSSQASDDSTTNLWYNNATKRGNS